MFNTKCKLEAISVTENGVAIENLEEKTQMFKWVDVNHIAVFKKDELATDLLCIEFGLPENMKITIHEEMEGYDTVVQAMHLELEGIEKNWYTKIVHPPFESNYRVIYETGA